MTHEIEINFFNYCFLYILTFERKVMTNMIIRIIPVLIQVETGSFKFPDEAIGTSGERGRLQIRQSVVDDVNRIYFNRKKYTLNDMRNPKISGEVCFYYLNYYCNPKKLGREPTFEDLARVWNGGPKGYKKSSTLKYWSRAKPLLQRYMRKKS